MDGSSLSNVDDAMSLWKAPHHRFPVWMDPDHQPWMMQCY